MVDKYSDSFNAHSESLRLKSEAADRDDLNFAQGDVEVGRMRKHLPSEEIDPITGKKKRDRVAEAMQRTLEQLLLDEQYRIAHENLIGAINNAANVTQSTLERVVSELAGVRGQMTDLLSSAAKLPDGTKVFRDKDGNVRNEDGEIVPPDEAAAIEWTGQEPTYEEYLALKGRITELENAERELRGIETEIGGIRDRATDNENPYAPDELDGAKEQVDELRERIKEINTQVFDDAHYKATSDLINDNSSVSSDHAPSGVIPLVKPVS